MKTWIFTLTFLACALTSFATQNKKTVKLRLQSPTGNVSDVTVYFDQGVTDLYSISQDAPMVFAKVPGTPEFYGYTLDGVACSILAYGDLSATTTVQLGSTTGYNATYNISAIELDNFDPTTVITLEDRLLDTFIDLRENFYQVALDSSTATSGRFFIQVTYPAQFSSQNSNCQNTGGQIGVTADSALTWKTIQLLNSSNQILATDSNVDGHIAFDSLQAGDYQVLFSHGPYTATKNFNVAGNFVVASIGTPPNKIYVNEDVVFSAIATNADAYQWDFGDSTLIDGVAHPDQTYLAPGQYTVNLVCSNALGCTDSAQATVIVYPDPTAIDNVTGNNAKITAYQKIITVKMGDAPAAGAVINVYNLLGQSVLNQPVEQATAEFDLSNQPSGYYLVSLKNNDKVTTQKILLAQ